MLHTTGDHEGTWWERAAALGEVRRTTVPEHRFGVMFEHPSHRADAIRLDILDREGGAFLDLDVITLRPFAPLHDANRGVTIGWEEDGVALCPAVVLAEPGSLFVKAWIAGYDPVTSDWRGFRSRGQDEFWGEMSTRYPVHLASKHPGSVRLLPPGDFYPVHWRGHESHRLFRPVSDGGLTPDDLGDAYALHLWPAGSWTRYLAGLTPEAVATGRTTLTRLLAPLMEGVAPCR